jgi:hypothetical protein
MRRLFTLTYPETMNAAATSLKLDFNTGEDTMIVVEKRKDAMGPL